MGDGYDNKKIFKMVIIIGVLCLFVGIATRLYQKTRTTLSDYAEKNPEVALAKPEKEAEDIDNFFYTVGDKDYKFHVMYYNAEHEKCTAEVTAKVEDPDEVLKVIYDLFKAGHEYSDESEIKEFLDRFE